jgi:hypothetical protein
MIMKPGALGSLVALSLGLLGCADTQPLAALDDDHPLATAVTAVSGELDAHRARVQGLTSRDALRVELARHEGSVRPLYDELRERVDEMTSCAAPASRVELVALVSGIEATERGRAAAIADARSFAHARLIAEVYAAGIAANVERIVTVAVEQDGCRP